MKKKLIRLISCVMMAFMLIAMMPIAEQIVVPEDGQKLFTADAATLSVKSLWASRHDIGKVLFKWTKKAGAEVTGWSLKYRMRKIGGNATWSKWEYKDVAANTMEALIDIPRDWVIEIHAQAKGDTTWSTGIITTPAGGKYQAMKNAYVKNIKTNKRVLNTLTLKEGESITVRPDHEYSIADFNKRPRLYPNHMLYDIADKSIISIKDSKGNLYKGGMIDGNATITGAKAGSTTLICRAPNGRTHVLNVTVKGAGPDNAVQIYYPDEYVPTKIDKAKVYTFDGSTIGKDADGNTVFLKNVLASNENKKVILKGTIQFAERYKVGSNTEIDATEGKTGIGAGATIYSASNGDGCLTNEITSGNYDSVKNIIIRGGTWKKASGYHKKTMMLFAHANTIRIENIYEECDYDGGHCVELVACKDVIVKNCNLQMKGTNFTNNEDEPMQLDHANKVTSPTLPDHLKNNNPCRNVQVVGCTLQGGRGFCSGHCGNDQTAQSYYHYSVVLQNNKITGQTAEALALYNVVGLEVTGNTIRTNTKDITNFRSDGMCVRIPTGSTAPKDMARSTITIKNNTVYGGRSGIIVNTQSSSDFGYVFITGNTVYYKGTDSRAITVSKWYQDKSSPGCIEAVISGNTTKKGW